MECCNVATGKQLTDVSEDYWKQQEERHFLDFLTLKKPLLSFETSVLFTDPSVVTYQRISVFSDTAVRTGSLAQGVTMLSV
jgi:hypothetical protein